MGGEQGYTSWLWGRCWRDQLEVEGTNSGYPTCLARSKPDGRALILWPAAGCHSTDREEAGLWKNTWSAVKHPAACLLVPEADTPIARKTMRSFHNCPSSLQQPLRPELGANQLFWTEGWLQLNTKPLLFAWDGEHLLLRLLPTFLPGAKQASSDACAEGLGVEEWFPQQLLCLQRKGLSHLREFPFTPLVSGAEEEGLEINNIKCCRTCRAWLWQEGISLLCQTWPHCTLQPPWRWFYSTLLLLGAEYGREEGVWNIVSSAPCLGLTPPLGEHSPLQTLFNLH